MQKLINKMTVLISVIVTASLMFICNLLDAIDKKSVTTFISDTFSRRIHVTLVLLAIVLFTALLYKKSKYQITVAAVFGLLTYDVLAAFISTFSNLITGTYHGGYIALYTLVFLLCGAATAAFAILAFRAFTGSKKPVLGMKFDLFAIIACAIPAFIAFITFMLDTLFTLIEYSDYFTALTFITSILEMLITIAFFFTVFTFAINAEFPKYALVKDSDQE